MPEMPIPCLALVTDHALFEPDSLASQVQSAVAGGVDLVQLRHKVAPAGELLALARQLRDVTRDKALLLVNDRVDVALACGADGVQLGEDGLPPAEARRLLGPGPLIGRSVHSVEGAVRAEADGADFLLLGTVFPSPSHPTGQATGPGLLARVRRAVGLPILGIGGITAHNVAEVMAAGAQGVAVISAILGTPDPAHAASELREALAAAWTSQQSAP
jgi:thiamine-phosphate pyrophosphorylase